VQLTSRTGKPGAGNKPRSTVYEKTYKKHVDVNGKGKNKES